MNVITTMYPNFLSQLFEAFINSAGNYYYQKQTKNRLSKVERDHKVFIDYTTASSKGCIPAGTCKQVQSYTHPTHISHNSQAYRILKHKLLIKLKGSPGPFVTGRIIMHNVNMYNINGCLQQHEDDSHNTSLASTTSTSSSTSTRTSILRYQGKFLQCVPKQYCNTMAERRNSVVRLQLITITILFAEQATL